MARRGVYYFILLLLIYKKACVFTSDSYRHSHMSQNIIVLVLINIQLCGKSTTSQSPRFFSHFYVYVKYHSLAKINEFSYYFILL